MARRSFLGMRMDDGNNNNHRTYTTARRAIGRSALPTRAHAPNRRGGSSMLVPSGTKQGLDEYFVADDELDTLRDQTQSFAMHIITSMHLAGLDRRYGTIGDEATRLRMALGDSGDGSSIDYELMYSLRAVDTSPLQLIVDSLRESEDRRGQKSMEVFTRLSAALSEVSRMSATRFLAGVPTSETSAAFQFLLGPTDPSDWIRELVGPSGRLLTPSPTAFLYLTILDPFAYGVSSERAVMTFLASMLARAKVQEQSDADEQTTDVDDFIARESVLSLLDAESIDNTELERFREAVEKMPQFVEFKRCVRAHSASEAPKSSPSFHAIYTVLKATYLLHFACSWMSIQVGKIVSEEANQPLPTSSSSVTEFKYAVTESNQDALQQALTHLDATEAMLAKNNNRRDKIATYADYVLAIIAASTTAAHVEQASRATDRHTRIPERAFKGSTTAVNYASLTTLLEKAIKDSKTTLAELNDVAAWDALKSVETTKIKNLLMFDAYDMTVRSMSKRDAEEYVETHDLTSDVGLEHMKFVATAMRFYLLYLLHASRIHTSAPAHSPSGSRAYKLATAIFFLYRLHDFMRQMYRIPQTMVDEPTIVTMLRKSGWSSTSGVESGTSAQAVFNKAFESLTYMLAHSTLYSHSLIGDMSRTTRLVHHIHKTREHNVQLMGILQRKVLDTVPACHPFMRAEETQMTLPASVAASMLPTTHNAPLEWGPADLVFRSEITAGTKQIPTNDVRYLLRAVVGESAFAKLAHEQRGSINLIEKIKENNNAKIKEAIQKIGSGGTM